MTERPARWSRFGTVVLLGLAGAALAAVAAAKPWYAAEKASAAAPAVSGPDSRADSPLALALALVVLAAWGVVLVSRTRGRRIALGLAALAGAGVVACVAAAPSTLPGQIRDRLGEDHARVSSSGWLVAAGIGALLAVLAAVVGWRAAPSWPSMGAKYDAPTSPTRDETDLWKALDAGVDPTVDPDPGRSPDAPGDPEPPSTSAAP